MDRPDWDMYFLTIAKDVASRSTCPRASVGAVIVKDNRILATGYNGALPGSPHCTEVGCLMENDHCIRAVHAETNAVAQAAKFGIPVKDAVVYLWSNSDIPACLKCTQVMRAAGITEVIDKVSKYP